MRKRKIQEHFDFSNIGIRKYGKIKLSLDQNGDCEIITHTPDYNMDIPKFYIHDSNGNELGWINLYDLNYDKKLNLTKEDKKSIYQFMIAPDMICPNKINTWQGICMMYLTNFNYYVHEDNEELTNQYIDLPMPDYNNL